MSVLPVLMYHHVNPNRGDMVTASLEVFEAQMRHIRDAGFKSLTLDELVSFMEGGFSPGAKSVAVTFDDGYLDNFVYAYPVLKKYSVKAAVFLVTGWVDAATKANGRAGGGRRIDALKERCPTHDETKRLAEEGRYEDFVMDWAMAEEMRSSGLVEFHSHTRTHRGCDELAAEELAEELMISKTAIERNLGTECAHLCWPRGKHNEMAVSAAREAGYRGVFTTRPGVVKEGDDPFHIKRIAVKDRAQWFKTRLRIYSSRMLTDVYMRMRGKGS